MRALVVFHDKGCHRLDFLLQPRFRHVFCAVAVDGFWLVIDGKAGVPEFQVAASQQVDLALFYRKQGFVVVETETGDRPLRAPLVVNNCVGVVKTALSIRAPFAQTPYALYKVLRRRAIGGAAEGPVDAVSSRKVAVFPTEAAGRPGTAARADAGRPRDRAAPRNATPGRP